MIAIKTTSPRIKSPLFFIRTLFAEACQPSMETPCLCPSKGHKHGGRNVTKTSVVEFAIEKKSFTLELRHIEINASSSASTV